MLPSWAAEIVAVLSLAVAGTFAGDVGAIAAQAGQPSQSVETAFLAASAGEADYPRQSSVSNPSAGGGTLYVSMLKGNQVKMCGIGFSWQTNKKENVYVSANHCQPGTTNPAIYRGKETKTGVLVASTIGTFKKTSVFASQKTDMSLITKTPNTSKNRQLEGKLYSSTSISSRTVKSVKGTVTPKKGLSVCLAGSRYGTVCDYTVVGPILVLKTEVGDLKNTWRADRAGKCLNKPGDSGSPAYQSTAKGVYVMGVLTATNQSTTNCSIYITDLTVLKKYFGGTIITAP